MVKEEEKYEKVISIIRKSKPVIKNTDDIEERVLNEVKGTQRKERVNFNIFDFLFGWVFIDWARKSLVTISFVLVGFFIYQQSLILKRINMLENQTIKGESQFIRISPVNYDDPSELRKVTLFRLKTGRIPLNSKQVDELLDSYDELEHKYKDLIRIIENDPELKKTIDEKLSERNKRKLNL